MGEKPLLQKLGNIKNGDALSISPRLPRTGGSAGDNRLIVLLPNTEKSISYCTGGSAASFISSLNESVFGMCSMT